MPRRHSFAVKETAVLFFTHRRAFSPTRSILCEVSPRPPRPAEARTRLVNRHLFSSRAEPDFITRILGPQTFRRCRVRQRRLRIAD